MKKAAWIGTMENVIDGLFAVDILYNFRTAYVDDQVPPPYGTQPLNPSLSVAVV